MCETGLFVAFFGVHGGQKELVNLQAVISGVAAFVLRAAHDPKAAFFRVFERVEVAFDAFETFDTKDDFNAVRGLAAATVHDGSTQTPAEGQVTVVQDRINFIVHSRWSMVDGRFKITG